MFFTSTQELAGIITGTATGNVVVSGITLVVDLRYFAEEIEAAAAGRKPKRVPRTIITLDKLSKDLRPELQPGRWRIHIRVELNSRNPCRIRQRRVSAVYTVDISHYLRPIDGPRIANVTVFQKFDSIATTQIEERYILSEVVYLSALHEARMRIAVNVPSWASWNIRIVSI